MKSESEVTPHSARVGPILATGLTGFVGRRLAPMLAQQFGPDQVVALVNSTDHSKQEQEQRLRLHDLGIQTIPVDLSTGTGADLIPENSRCVIHLASNTDTSSSNHEINERSTRLILEKCSKSSEPTVIIFASTIAVYDNRSALQLSADEVSVLRRPLTIYGRSKLMCEEILESSASIGKIRAVIIRVPAVFGTGSRTGGLFDIADTMTKKQSLIARLNYPGKIGIVSVETLAEFICAVAKEETSRSSPLDGSVTYLPVSENVTYSWLFHSRAADHKITLRSLEVPNIFWSIIRIVLRFLLKLEPILPHRFHNRIWQMFLVTSGAYGCSPRYTWTESPILHRRYSTTTQVSQ